MFSLGLVACVYMSWYAVLLYRVCMGGGDVWTYDGAYEPPGGFRSVYSSVLILMICICALVGGLIVPVGVYIYARTVRLNGMRGYHVCIICGKRWCRRLSRFDWACL